MTHPFIRRLVTRPVFFLLAVLLLSSPASGQQKFEPTGASYREAVGRGQVGEYAVAMEALGSRAEAEQDWAKASSAYTIAAAAVIRVGDLQKAIFLAATAVELALKTKNPSLQTNAILRLADICGRAGQRQQEREWLEKARTIVERMEAGVNKDFAAARLYRQLGENYLSQGEIKQAIEFLSHSVTLWDARLSYLKSPLGAGMRNLEDTTQQAENQISITLHRLGRAYLQARNPREAIRSLTRGLGIVRAASLKSAIEASLLIWLGEAYLALYDFGRAKESFDRGLQVSEDRRQSGNIRTASGMIGDLLLKTGKPSEAVPYYKKAIDSVETTRSLFEFGELRASFFDDKGRHYSGIIRAHLGANNVEEAFNYSERARSRAFLDTLGSKVQLSREKGNLREEEKALMEGFVRIGTRIATEADETTRVEERPSDDLIALNAKYSAFISKARRVHKEQSSLMSVEPLNLREVQGLLEPGQTLMQYFVAPEKTFLWVVEKDRLNALTVSISQKDLTQKVDALRKSIAKLNPVREYQSLAREIHEFLIRPALPHIRGKDMIVVPHGVLHYLPFQALYSAKGKYLVEDYAISYLSSASLMQFTKEKRRVRGDKVLAFGNPDLGNPEKELKFAELEAGEIKKLYPKSTVLLRKDATKLNLKDPPSSYDILHFAAHAELKGDDPLSSALLLAKDDGDEGRLQVREVFEMELNANLVVLSGCETGLGKLSSGDEFVGLTRAFIYAGTPSVVASLWKVDDASTAHLMSSFYRNLKTKSKVESLRQAQLEMIRGKVSGQLLAQRGVGEESGSWGKSQQRRLCLKPRFHYHILTSGRRLFW